MTTLTFPDIRSPRLSPDSDAINVFKEESSAWVSTLSPAECEALLLYTNTYYKNLNAELRNSAIATTQDMIDVLDVALGKNVNENYSLVYRGIGATTLHGNMEIDEDGHEIISFNSYLSTTMCPALASNFTTDGGIILEILTKSACAVGDYSIKESRELEKIIARDKKFRIINKVEGAKFYLGSEHQGEIYDFCSKSDVTIHQLLEI